jgi:VanZ family protein
MYCVQLEANLTMSFFFHPYRAGLRWLPALCLAIAIFIFSGMPKDEVSDSYHSLEVGVQTISPPAANPTPSATTPAIDWLKVGHGIGYFWLGVSVLFALTARSRWSPSLALILCCLYAVTDEFHQIFTPGRTASVRDILIDTLAALVGVAIMLGVMASRKYFRKTRP